MRKYSLQGSKERKDIEQNKSTQMSLTTALNLQEYEIL